METIYLLPKNQYLFATIIFCCKVGHKFDYAQSKLSQKIQLLAQFAIKSQIIILFGANALEGDSKLRLDARCVERGGVKRLAMAVVILNSHRDNLVESVDDVGCDIIAISILVAI